MYIVPDAKIVNEYQLKINQNKENKTLFRGRRRGSKIISQKLIVCVCYKTFC